MWVHYSLEFISWYAPPEWWVKVNCDGSVDTQCRASCGGLIRDSAGCYIRGFAANLGFCPITVMEVWGAYYSFLLAW